jgi:hypothetical protein
MRASFYMPQSACSACKLKDKVNDDYASLADPATRLIGLGEAEGVRFGDHAERRGRSWAAGEQLSVRAETQGTQRSPSRDRPASQMPQHRVGQRTVSSAVRASSRAMSSRAWAPSLARKLSQS